MQRSSLHREKSHDNTSPGIVPLDDLPIVELSNQDLSKAERLASNRARSYVSIDGGRIYGTQSGRDVHLTGIIGEIAVSKCFDTPLDENTYFRGDDGFDTVLNGLTIDVKCTRTGALDRPDLIVPVDPEPEADLYFLTHWIGDREVRLIGYAKREHVVNRDPERAPGTTLNYIVSPTELHLPWDTPRAEFLMDLLFPTGELP